MLGGNGLTQTIFSLVKRNSFTKGKTSLISVSDHYTHSKQTFWDEKFTITLYNKSWVLQMNTPVHLGTTVRLWYSSDCKEGDGDKEIAASQGASLPFPLICCWKCFNLHHFDLLLRDHKSQWKLSHLPNILEWWQQDKSIPPPSIIYTVLQENETKWQPAPMTATPADKPYKPGPNSIQPIIFVQIVSQYELLLSYFSYCGLYGT